MKKRTLQALSVALCFVMVLSGCFGTGTSQSSSDSSVAETSSGGKGRYMQKELNIPEKIGEITKILQLENGNLLLFGNDTDITLSDNWMLWESADFGETWNEITPDWIKEMKNLAVSAIDFTDINNAIYFAQSSDKEIDAQLDEIYRSGEIGSPEVMEKAKALRAQLQEICVVTDGVVKKLDTLPDIGGNYFYLSNFELSSNGAAISSSNSTIFTLNPETGEASDFKVDESRGNSNGTYTVFESTLYTISDNKIMIYDLEGSAEGKEISISDESSSKMPTGNYSHYDNIINVSPDGKDLYYANSRGIFHVIPEGELIERMVDGSLTSLGSPNVSLNSLLANSEDSSFIVSASDNGERYLYKYYYDPNVPSVPTHELNVYSLYPDQIMQQATSMYQIENPDIKVNCISGIDYQSGITGEDAIKNISTEILAGKGPDILILDGMPIKSYMDKGVLLDINELVGSDIESGKYIKNIAETFKKENSIYAMPLKFRTSTILQSSEININSFEDLLAYYEANPSDNSPIYLEDLHYFYPFFTKGWFLEDGSLDTEVMKASLPLLERYSKLFKPIRENQYNVLGDTMTAGVLYGSNITNVAIGDLYSIDDLQAPYSAIKKRDNNGSFTLFPQNEKTYIPTSIISINANSTKQDMAKLFLQFTLSEKVQASTMYSGLPVNNAALATATISPYPEGDNDGSTMSMGFALAAAEESVTDFTEDDIIEDSQSSDDTVEENIVVDGASISDAVPEDSTNKSTGSESVSEDLIMAGSSDENQYFELQMFWPTEEELNDIVSQFETLDTPFIENLTVRNIVMDAIITYDDETNIGSINSSEYIENEIIQKLAIYLAE